MSVYIGLTDNHAKTVFDACIAVADRIHTMLAVNNGRTSAGIHACITH
jgi:hypothetical protein